jgi:tetratricopeptide (TPR) repeat protein
VSRARAHTLAAPSRQARASRAVHRSADSAIAWLLGVALVAAGITAFGGAVNLPFVFDDHGSIVENPYITQISRPLQAMRAPVQSAFAGRPVASLGLAINYAFGGLDPAAFHTWNIALHLLCGLVLLAILRRTLALPQLAARFGAASDGLAFACALIWAVHPLQTEVVDYVTQRTESTMALFYLATLYASIRALSRSEARRGLWEAVAVLACLLGAGSKESMATAPVMVLLYDAVFVSGSVRFAIRDRPRLYAGLALSWVVIGAIIAAGPRWRSAGFSSGVSPWTYVVNQPELLFTYVRLAVWPIRQVFDYGVPRAIPLAQVWPYAAIVVAGISSTIVAWRRHRELAFLGTWFFVTLAPTSSVVPIATEVGAERRMYLPLIAAVAFVVLGAFRLLDRAEGKLAASRTMTMALSLLTAAALLMGLTIRRNAEYATEARLWQTVVDRRPHGRAHYSLALELRQLGRRDEAIAHFQAALADTPEANYALGLELDAEGRHEEAVEHYRAFLAAKPDDVNAPSARVMLGRSLSAAGRFELARQEFSAALEMRPTNTDARTGLADAWFREGRYDEAIAAYQELLTQGPGTARTYTSLGIALVGRNREADAVTAFERAVELAPADPALRSNLGNSLASLGRLDEAAAQYRQAIKLREHDVSAYFGLGLVLRAQGRLDEAAGALRQVLRLDPGNQDAQSNLADVLAALRTRDRTR